MSYADAKARLLTHAQTAGATLTPPIQDVAIGFPVPAGRRVRLYYGGEAEVEKMGGRYTLNSELVSKVTMIAAWWNVTTLNAEQAAVIDSEAEAFTDALRTAVDGDTSLNGEMDNTTLGYGTPDIVIVGNTRYLMVLWVATTDFSEYTIAR